MKGTIEPGESGVATAERELKEEAGITLKVEHQLLEWQRHPDEPKWTIYLMEAGDQLPERWDHYCNDDGGHVFEYFWHLLVEEPDQEWHEMFVDALTTIRQAVLKT